MKHMDIFADEPFTSLSKLDMLSVDSYTESPSLNIEYPNYIDTFILPILVKSMLLENTERKGIHIYGRYATGVRHILRFIPLVAEGVVSLNCISNDTSRDELNRIAGKYFVLRLDELHECDIWDGIKSKLADYLHSLDVYFENNIAIEETYIEQLSRMLKAFEHKYSNKGLLIVIENCLPCDNVENIRIFQALGELCSMHRFSFLLGAHFSIFKQCNILSSCEQILKCKDRFIDLEIQWNNLLMPNSCE